MSFRTRSPPHLLAALAAIGGWVGCEAGTPPGTPAPSAPTFATSRQAILAYGEPCELQEDCETQVCLSTPAA